MTDRMRLRAIAEANGWTAVKPLNPPIFLRWDCFIQDGRKVRLYWKKHTLIGVGRGTGVSPGDEARKDHGYSVAELVEIAKTWLKDYSQDLPARRSAGDRHKSGFPAVRHERPNRSDCSDSLGDEKSRSSIEGSSRRAWRRLFTANGGQELSFGVLALLRFAFSGAGSGAG